MREILIEPYVIESMVSNQKAEKLWSDLWEESEGTQQDMLKLREIVEKLGKKDRDLYLMRFIDGMRQTEIADFINVSQYAVSCQLKVLKRRIKVLHSLPHVDWELIKKSIRADMNDKACDILNMHLDHHSKANIARELNVTRQTVHGRIKRITKNLKKKSLNKEYKRAYDYLMILEGSGSVLRS